MAQPYENNNFIVISSSARTASFNTEFIRYIDNTINSCIVYIDVTAASGTTPTLLATIQSLDPASGKWVAIAGATTASITAVGTYTLSLGRGIPAVANVSVNGLLPNTIRISFVVGGTTPSFTLSAGVTFTA